MKTRILRRRGFTLLELLVVMTIIAILAAGIIATTQFAIRKARSVQALNMAVGIANGINQFKNEYGRWPYPKGTTSKEDFESDETFMLTLIGRDTDASSPNKKGINFVDSLPLAKGTPAVNGIVYNAAGDRGDVFDPWGNRFIIRIDHDGDGKVSSPEGGDLWVKVAVFSKGNDKDSDSGGTTSEKNKDNVRSW